MPQIDNSLDVFIIVLLIVFAFILESCSHICMSKISRKLANNNCLRIATKLIFAGLFVLLFCKYELSIHFLLFIIMTFCLVIISIVDFNYRIIPDIFPILLVISGLLLCIFNLTLGNSNLERFLNALFGVIVGGGIIVLMNVFGKLVYKKEVMGGGDIKLMAGVGAIIGYEKVIFAILIAIFLCAFFGLVMILIKKLDKKGYVSFGPFLAGGAYMSLFLPNFFDVVYKLF